jgi:hypothetical protein
VVVLPYILLDKVRYLLVKGERCSFLDFLLLVVKDTCFDLKCLLLVRVEKVGSGM